MPISLQRYIDIVSGVGAANNVSTRQLIGRFFDDNVLIPSNSQVTFDNAADVLSYFGTGEEYHRAVQYFGWVSKNITSPRALSFARWNSAACAPVIFGHKASQLVATWTAITAGAFTLQMGTTTHDFTGLDFSGAGSLSAVATILQNAIQAITAGGALWTGATVVWESTNQQFNLLGGATGTATISVTAAVSNNILSTLGWASADTIIGDGAGVQTLTACLTQSAAVNNNFGSFGFMRTAALNLTQVTEIATWNEAQNVMFMYCLPVTAANASSWFTALAAIGGTAATLDPVLINQYPEMEPMQIMAATNYAAANSTQNYMFQVFPNLSASVTTDADANTYDGLRINYYGNTQTAGQIINFYQRGIMWGTSTDPLDQNTYANEVWLKDALGAALMTLLLALGKVSANLSGQAQILNIMQGVVDQALLNGTISVGKLLTNVQKSFITETTDDQNAWKQVQNIGYWLGIEFVPTVVDGQNEFIAQYTLIYSKDDVIRQINGSDILI